MARSDMSRTLENFCGLVPERQRRAQKFSSSEACRWSKLNVPANTDLDRTYFHVKQDMSLIILIHDQ